MTRVIYFSNVTENTSRFVKKLDVPALRIPLRPADEPVFADGGYILIVPTYGSGDDGKAVPRQVIRFLNHEPNRLLLRGVVGSGNLNFGKSFCLAAELIAAKCNTPVLARFEISGTPEDASRIQDQLERITC